MSFGIQDSEKETSRKIIIHHICRRPNKSLLLHTIETKSILTLSSAKKTVNEEKLNLPSVKTNRNRQTKRRSAFRAKNEGNTSHLNQLGEAKKESFRNRAL